MKKSFFFRQILFFTFITVLFTGVLTAGIYIYHVHNSFIQRAAANISQHISTVAEQHIKYLDSEITEAEYKRYLNDQRFLPMAATFVLEDKDTVFYSRPGDMSEYLASLKALESAFAGKSVYEIKKDVPFDMRISPPRNGEMGIPGNRNVRFRSRAPVGGLLVAAPVERDGGVKAVIAVIQPINDINESMGSLLKSLITSTVIVMLLMTVVAYIVSHKMSKPITRLSDASLAMANGDLTARVDVACSGEIGQMARSFNILAETLSRNISELILERNRLSLVINSLSEGIIAVDGDFEVSHVNAAAFFLLGINKNSPSEQTLEVYNLRELFENPQESTVIEVGGERYIRITVSAIAQSGGAVALLQDVSEEERTEMMRRNYVANVSHELRTPLTAIRALVEPLMEGIVKSESDKARYLRIIHDESLRMANLINDLLTLSRLQSGRDEEQKRDVSINSLVTDVVERYRVIADEKDIVLKIITEPNNERLHLYSQRLEQAIIILVDNAIKFTRSGGEVVVSVVGGERPCISVADRGMGIAREDLPHVLERFYKADKARNTKGSGLGLAIAKEICDSDGYALEAASELGVGSTFTIRL